MKMICTLVLSILLTGCRKDAVLPDPTSTTLDVMSQPAWKTERLDDTYFIQFPKNYKGGIQPTIEGPEFSLLRDDPGAYFLSPYSIRLTGNTPLPTPQPDSITHGNLVLNKSVLFRREGQVQGLFYYAEQPQTLGKMYLLQNGRLGFTILVQYDFASHQEVLGILQTIQPK